ncbi:MAG: PAS domain S-box protein [Candidatus Melainabacteria bacterium]|nr:PAS domain S-box protein [Candidatus Melainabacteria bacterium]
MNYKPEELLNALVSCSPDGYVASNEFGKIIFINEVIERITGWSFDELLGQETGKIYSLPESLLSKASGTESLTKPQAAILFRRDGKKITLKARQIEIKNLNDKKNQNRFKGYLIIFHTENPIVSNLDRAQIEFVSTVSHELRTPLTSIKGFAETLLRSGDKLLEENKKKYTTIIKEQADRLIRLVEDLLAVSRLESQNYQLTVRALDLRKNIDKVCDSLSSKSLNHKVLQKIEEDIPHVWADADRLEQILTNLIDNAIKYSPDGGVVTIKVSTLKNDQNVKDRLKIEVIDQGVGIKENDLPKIFTKFGRLDNPLTRQTQGTGLGLFITKSLVLALKGEIDVSSKPGETIFSVILPAVISNQAIPLSTSEPKNKSEEIIN